MRKQRPVFRLSIFVLSFFLLCGCGTRRYDWVLTIDGTPIAPGLYRLFQIQAYSEAAQATSDSDKMFSQTISGKSTQDWIAERTSNLLCAYQYYETQFSAKELSFTEAQQAQIDARAAEDWAEVCAIYERNGVSKEDFYRYDQNSLKAQALFAAAYADVTDEQIREFLDRNFARLDYVQLPLTGPDGALADEVTAALQKTVDSALSQLQNGSDWATTAQKLAERCYRAAGFTVNSSEPSSFVHTSYINLSTTADASSESLAAAVSATEPGKYGVFESPGAYCVLFCRQPNYTTQQEFSDLRTAVLYQMKGAEFSAAVSNACSDYNVLSDVDAVRFYSPQKLDLSSGTASSTAESSSDLP